MDVSLAAWHYQTDVYDGRSPVMAFRAAFGVTMDPLAAKFEAILSERRGSGGNSA